MIRSRNSEHAAIMRQLTAFPQLREVLRDLVVALEQLNVDYDAFSGPPRTNLLEAHEYLGKAATQLTRLGGRHARRLVAAVKAEQELLTQQHYAMTTTFAELRKIVQEAGAEILGALQGYLTDGSSPAAEITAVVDDAVERMSVLPDRFGETAEYHDLGA